MNARAPLALLSAPFVLGAAGCDLFESATATTVVAGTLVKTPELSVMGRFDVPSEVVASAWVAERDSATSTNEPAPISGATVRVTFAGNQVPLEEQSQDGLYLVRSSEAPSLSYQGGNTYTFRATVPDDSAAEFGGTVMAPTALTPAALTLSPQPTELLPGFSEVLRHPKSTDLNVAWGEQFGRYAYVSVFRADMSDPSNPQLVFDNRPESAGDFIEFVVGTPPTDITIPANTFSVDGVYAVLVVTMNRHDDLLPNTFLGSPILAGSGAAIFLGVGDI